MYEVYYNGIYLTEFEDEAEAEDYIQVCKDDHPEVWMDLYKIVEVK